MLTALNDNYEAIQELRDTGYGAADFEVKKAMVEFSIPASIGVERHFFANKEVYYRTDTSEPIAVHGQRYKPLQYREMIDKTRDMIERCNLDATGINESIQVSPNGGMCAVNYTLPAKEYLTPDGDKGCVKVMALSSFNGIWSFILSLAFEQGACLNSQIFIKNPASIYKARHTNKLDIDKGVYVLGKTANIIEDEIAKSGEGTSGQTELPRKKLENNFVVNYPNSIQEQEKIVKSLDGLLKKTKYLESNYQQELDALDELKKSILQKAFNGEL